ncbi:hypothetical protein DPMN_112263 [Dreissena polymorpha]|uniref:Uncharacterized protein n=1 Tax=Dreissena polymorpha TaxID=45954 RepID=A0A9D4QQH6_DREPO|nr:hypothetical protein DPMN_112263 [Dreissena polymorpha]
MSDGGSGWWSVELLSRSWTDLLSRAARGWMWERLSRVLLRLRAQAGRAGGPSLARSAGVRLCGGGWLYTLVTETRYCLSRLTDANNMNSNTTSALDKYTTNRI